MKEKVLAAIADMQSKIAYDHKKHIYTNAVTGKWLQGVSTVSSIVPKDWLAAWGAKEAVKFLGYTDYDDLSEAKRTLELIKGMTPEAWVDYLKEAKGASSRKSKQALIDGTKGHKWLEDFVKARIEGTPIPALLESGEMARPFLQFMEWERENIEEWIASEFKVIYEEKGYAGTVDAAAIMAGGKLSLIDFKFASHISEDYHLQTAGYVAPFEQYGIKFDQRVILRLPKTLEREEWKDGVYTKVPNDLQDYRVWTDYEGDKIAFFGALPVKQWINQFK